MVEEVEQTSSAQWRSSKTSTSGPHRRGASNKRRQAANASSRRSTCGSVEREQRPEVCLDPLGLPRVGHEVAHRAAQLRLRRRRRRRVSRIAGLRLDHLTERPERDAVAVRKTAAAAPRDEAGLVARARAGAPRRAGSCRSPARRSASRAERCGRGVREPACRGSGSAPPCGRRAERAAHLVRRPQLGGHAQRLVDRDGLGLPPRLEEPALAVFDRSLASLGTSTRRRARCRCRLPPRSGTSS